jgi:molybdopterin synthase catalytic subunit
MDDFVDITSDRLDAGAMMTRVSTPSAGATSVFVGTTRNTFEGKIVTRLEYEAYAPMAKKELRKLCSAVRKKWQVEKVAVIHRVGVVDVEEASVIIAISSQHRKNCLDAVQFAIDELKATVPIWKREVYADGTKSWKENKECAWANTESVSVSSSEDEVEVDESLVQITASKAEVDRRIEAFIERKRAEINNSNVLEFCNRHISEQPEFSCARTDSVVYRRKDGTSHLRQSQVFNPEGPQTQTDSFLPPLAKRIKTEEAAAVESDDQPSGSGSGDLPVGIRERIVDLEHKVPVPMFTANGPVPKDVYARIKALEDRVRYLEGLSPEYFQDLVKKEDGATFPDEDEDPSRKSAAAAARSEDLAKSLSGINSRIQQLQASLMIKKRDTDK